MLVAGFLFPVEKSDWISPIVIQHKIGAGVINQFSQCLYLSSCLPSIYLPSTYCPPLPGLLWRSLKSSLTKQPPSN